MKQTYKKIMALLMSFALVFTMMPAMAFAATDSQQIVPIQHSRFLDITGINVKGAEVAAYNMPTASWAGEQDFNIYVSEADKNNSVEISFQVKDGSAYKLASGGNIGDTWTLQLVDGVAQKDVRIQAGKSAISPTTWLYIKFSVACTNPEGDAHTYNAGEVTKTPTCLEEGIKTYTCTCGATKEESLATVAHTWDEGTVTTSPTCTEKGVKSFACTVEGCDGTKTENINALGHDWNDGKVTKEATCGKDGIKTFVCKAEGCKEVKTTDIPATGEHKWNNGVITTVATCVDGVKTFTCSSCKTTKTESVEAKKEHRWNAGEVVKAATYYAKGQTKYTCEVCENTKTETDIPVIEDAVFVNSAYYLDTEGTKHEVAFEVQEGMLLYDGWSRDYVLPLYTFQVPENVEKIYIEATDIWNFADFAQICVPMEDGRLDMTPDQMSSYTGEMKKSGTTLELNVSAVIGMDKYIAMSDINNNYGFAALYKVAGLHVWDEGTVTKEPTCTEEGVMTYTCTYCAEVDDVVTKTEVIPADGHSMSFEEANAPTCVEDGNIAYYHCSVCNLDFEDEAGKTKLASVVDSAEGHKMTKTDAKAPTCTEDGDVAYYTCSVCEKNFADEAGKNPLDSVVDSAEGHKMTKTDAKAPTCIEDGNVAYYTCSACEKNFADEAGKNPLDSVVDSAKGHKYTSKVVEPTTEAEGYTMHTCDECGYVYKDAFVDKLPGQPADTPATPEGDKPADTPATPEGDKPADTPATPEGDKPADTPATPDADKPAEDQPTDEPADKEPVVEKQQLKAPAKVKASVIAKTGKIKLTWNKVKGAKEYKVYRATSKNGKYTLVKTVKGTSYINKSAKAGKTYFYKVKAVSADKNVLASKYSTVVKKTADLKMPVVTAKAKAKKQVKLTWKKVDGAKKYTVYRATSKNGKYKKIATTTKLTYTNKNLKSGKTYYYKVKAVAKNSAANSAFSTVDKCKAK